MSEYHVIYSIDHGVSTGFGLKSNEKTTERRTIDTSSGLSALRKSLIQAERLAQSYLTNTDGEVSVGFKIVQGDSLLDLRSLVEDELKKSLPNLDGGIQRELDTMFPTPDYCQVKDTLFDRIKGDRI